ncbi:helix-turn-helix domain-containing protein [Sphingobacterium wenxiniae]|uniref:Uncharacterized protein n=1 Tax=Sphingobacterium wenxiniae TaxID=683125 RepID=A0A1I6UAF9_9SPHI|nr:helix-turn-helix domain-containing protein [Sphingobacterium wenxiniae]SFS98402.1 hypothetical protein SAMN05660206_10887 [Sphingobacterium wenxiniae]
MEDRFYQLVSSVLRIEKMISTVVDEQSEDRSVALIMEDAGLQSEAKETDGEKVMYREEELMTVKEAMALLKVSRWKLTQMRKKAELSSISRDGRVRLIREEVEAARIWYSLRKGKI